jgi:hypothetical protein
MRQESRAVIEGKRLSVASTEDGVRTGGGGRAPEAKGPGHRVELGSPESLLSPCLEAGSAVCLASKWAS